EGVGVRLVRCRRQLVEGHAAVLKLGIDLRCLIRVSAFVSSPLRLRRGWFTEISPPHLQDGPGGFVRVVQQVQQGPDARCYPVRNCAVLFNRRRNQFCNLSANNEESSLEENQFWPFYIIRSVEEAARERCGLETCQDKVPGGATMGVETGQMRVKATSVFCLCHR